MKQELFETHYQDKWQAFEASLSALESRKRSHKAADVSAFAEQYRQVCHHLALAQERQYSPAPHARAQKKQRQLCQRKR